MTVWCNNHPVSFGTLSIDNAGAVAAMKKTIAANERKIAANEKQMRSLNTGARPAAQVAAAAKVAACGLTARPEPAHMSKKYDAIVKKAVTDGSWQFGSTLATLSAAWLSGDEVAGIAIQRGHRLANEKMKELQAKIA